MTGVSARGEDIGEASSCAKRLRLPGPRDSLPGGPRAWPSCAPELCANPGFRLFRKGEELMGVCTIREALCARMLSYSDPLSPAECKQALGVAAAGTAHQELVSTVSPVTKHTW